MIKNMGAADRVIRVLVALVIAALYFTGRVRGILGIILVVVAAVFLITSFVARCPGYLPLGISTRRRPEAGGSHPAS
jgi:K+-transporting ATPase A subunit